MHLLNALIIMLPVYIENDYCDFNNDIEMWSCL